MEPCFKTHPTHLILLDFVKIFWQQSPLQQIILSIMKDQYIVPTLGNALRSITTTEEQTITFSITTLHHVIFLYLAIHIFLYNILISLIPMKTVS